MKDKVPLIPYVAIAIAISAFCLICIFNYFWPDESNKSSYWIISTVIGVVSAIILAVLESYLLPSLSKKGRVWLIILICFVLALITFYVQYENIFPNSEDSTEISQLGKSVNHIPLERSRRTKPTTEEPSFVLPRNGFVYLGKVCEADGVLIWETVRPLNPSQKGEKFSEDLPLESITYVQDNEFNIYEEKQLGMGDSLVRHPSSYRIQGNIQLLEKTDCFQAWIYVELLNE